MTLDPFISTLAIPLNARVDQRVPKKLLLEQGMPGSGDKHMVQEGLEELLWLAALKPANIAVPSFHDATREYLEIAILSAALRPKAKAGRLAEIIHRCIPYPLLLVCVQGDTLGLSLAHKRHSQAEAGKVVIDGSLTSVEILMSKPPSESESRFLSSLAIADQPSEHLHSLYDGWVQRATALLASRITNNFTLAETPTAYQASRAALDEYARLTREMASLRAQAAKEKQLNRRVDLNLAIQRLDARLKTLASEL